MMHSFIFFLQVFSCFAMTGVIWIIQLVHYPSFSFISEHKFEAFNKFHQASITYIVMPLMLVEIITGALIFYLAPSQKIYLLLFFLTILIWLSTFLLSIPYHSELLNGYNADTINKLITTNWPRTILWTLRSSIFIYLLTSQKAWLGLFT